MAGTSVEKSGANVALLIRYGKAEIPTSATILQEGDTVHLLATSDDIAAFDSHLSGTKAAH
jgi:trk system potassium uptake protein TrkA